MFNFKLIKADGLGARQDLGYGEITGGISQRKHKKQKVLNTQEALVGENQYKLYNGSNNEKQEQNSEGIYLN